MIARYINLLRKRFDSLQQRERILIIVASVALVFALALLFYFDAANKREKTLKASEADLRQQISTLETRQTELVAQIANASLKPLQETKQALIDERQALDQVLASQGLQLLNPRQMRSLLHDLLASSGLDLVRMERLPVEIAFDTTSTTKGSDGEATQERNTDQPHGVKIYRHAMRIELEGTYNAMVNYLRKLEESGWKLMWKELEIETKEYPRARMGLTVYTLSLEEAWIGV